MTSPTPSHADGPDVDTVLFDLGNVLIEWDPRHLYRKLFGPDEAAMERFLDEVCTGTWNREMDAGKSFAQAVAERQQLFPDHAAMIAAWHHRWPEMLAGAIEGTVTLLEQLKARGTRLYALTNWSAETFPVAKARYRFLDWFEHVVVSGEIGLAKPDPAIFRHAVEHCGLTPERTLFVDDVAENIAAASGLGFRTLQFTGPESLERRLRELRLVD